MPTCEKAVTAEKMAQGRGAGLVDVDLLSWKLSPEVQQSSVLPLSLSLTDLEHKLTSKTESLSSWISFASSSEAYLSPKRLTNLLPPFVNKFHLNFSSVSVSLFWLCLYLSTPPVTTQHLGGFPGVLLLLL
ncbi:hypothetical protein AMECASPLE_020872 [Ameca splendens]|uniref:Uncharacterized protein n=1 Tax=Ameca splendens TaxID=208324 RepID=A0ABV0ZDZ5_9TELE